MIHRSLEHYLPVLSKGFPAVALVGPRQSGKTTLAKNLFPKHRYVSLESLDWRERAEQDPRGLLSDLGDKIILDEVQRVPALFSYLQEWLDEGGHHVVLTGSQQFLLMDSISQSLAGRIAHFELLPFTCCELLGQSKLDFQRGILRKFKGSKPKFSTLELMCKGFYPRIHAQSLNANRWLNDYIRTYVERDVRMLTQVADLSAFTLMIRLLASQAGSLLNMATLATQVGVSQPSIKRWISLLETSGIIFLLQPYHNNFGKRLLKSPKPYFIDTGLLCVLLGIRDSSQLELHPLRGHIFENLIVAEYYKQFFHHGNRPQMWFWRDSHGLEVDLLIESNGKLHPIEIKSTATWRKDLVSGMEKWLSLPGQEATQGLIIYDGEQVHGTQSKVATAPWWMCI